VSTTGAVSAGRDLTLQATGGAVTVAGSASATRALTVDTTAAATLNTVSGDSVLVRATDLNLNGSLQAKAATVESRNGALVLGDGVTAPAGALVLDNAEAGRITADTLKLYAGATNGTARGDAIVGDLTLDGARLKSVAVLAGPNQTVRVSGEVAPATSGSGAFIVGEKTAAGWTPKSVLVTGALGKSTTVNGVAFTDVRALGSVELNAVADVLIGTAQFISTIQGAATGDINVTRRLPTGILATGADVNRVFLTTGTATIRADGRVVQQSTSTLSDRPIGVFIANPQRSSLSLVLGRTGSAATGTPTLIDLSGALVNSSGTLLTGTVVAASTAIELDGFQPANSYRMNGCTIGSAGNCTPLSSSVVDVRIEKLMAGNLLQAQETPIPADPTITGAGNEEIWRSSELSEEEEE
jgi:hypothetical protein